MRKVNVNHDTVNSSIPPSPGGGLSQIVPSLGADVQKNGNDITPARASMDEGEKVSAFKGLGWLDRFLAVWIFLAIAIGIILGNFVPETGPALRKGEFIGVSIPISRPMISVSALFDVKYHSHWTTTSHDVPHPLQSTIRNSPLCFRETRNLDPDHL
jgi:hypothetical protein